MKITICQYNYRKYIGVLQKVWDYFKFYNGALIGDFLLFGIDGGAPVYAIVAAESVNSIAKKIFKKCPIAALTNKNIIYMAIEMNKELAENMPEGAVISKIGVEKLKNN